MQGNLNKHMLDSAAQFIEIKEEMQSLKTQNSLNANITDEKCDSVQSFVESIRQQLDTVSINLHKKLQSLGDVMKSSVRSPVRVNIVTSPRQ